MSMSTILDLPPIADESSRIIILGSEPGRASLETGQYYAHPWNNFWKIIYTIFGEEMTDNYEKRKDFVLKNRIALWDVLINCRQRSLRADSINDEIANDFNGFYSRYPNIRYVFFNGKLASDMYHDHIGWTKYCLDHYILPSSSGADVNKSLEDKIEEWKILRRFLEEIDENEKTMYEI